MASTIKLKNSTTSGNAPSSLAQGEVAINVVDGKLFYGTTSGNKVSSSFAFSHITASGDISASGTIYANEISLAEQEKIIFNNGGNSTTFIQGISNNLRLDADDDLLLYPDDDIKIGVGTSQYAWFLGNETEFRIEGDISSSGTIKTSKLSGGTTGDQSGSLYLSGSLTLRNNEAIPAVSASTLYDNSGHLYYGGGLVGGYHLSASATGNAPTVGYVKIYPTDFLNNDDSTYQRIVIEDDSNTYGIKVGTSGHELLQAVEIPAGWTATKYQIFASQNRVTDFIVVDMTDGSGTTDGTAGVCNTETILGSPFAVTATTYAMIKVTTTATADVVYGGYITIERRG